jgi:hypothetical protein
VPALSHVVVVVLENTGAEEALANSAFAAYAHSGALLRQSYGVAHDSLPNYLALTSGIAPTASTRADCPHFDCQVNAPNLAQQLDSAGVTWKAYFGGTDNPCLTPTPGQEDPFVSGYVTHHNPFVYYPSVGGSPDGGNDYCHAHLQTYDQLQKDAQNGRLPGFALVVPDSCLDGHDRPCDGGSPGGVETVMTWLEEMTDTLRRSSSWSDNSLLIVTFDEARKDESKGCCGSSGGGRVATVLISPLVRPGATSDKAYDEYSLLRTIEDGLGLPGHLGLAASRLAVTDVWR